MEKIYTVNKNKTGDDCGSDHELLIAKFRLKLKKVGKTTRSFRYDLNQIPYDFTVEVRNRFKGLDLIEYLKSYGHGFGWTPAVGDGRGGLVCCHSWGCKESG